MTDRVAFRIVQSQHIGSTVSINGFVIPRAFDGSGARMYGGRWNSKGTELTYLAGSQALSILEVVVHVLRPDQLNYYSLFEVRFDEKLISELPLDRLPQDWKNDPAPRSTKQIGDDWVTAQDSLILQVPSTIVTDEPNYLVNPNHPDLHKISISEPIPYPIDSRIKYFDQS